MDWSLPYPSRRSPVLADHVVATSQPLAVQAGLEAMRAGGNAVDAALAAAVTLTVVEPTSNGIGGDLFAIVWDGAVLHGLNASGRAPAGVDVERLTALPMMPLRGWDAVTVPGVVSGWVALHERFASLDLEQLVAPAAGYARHGFPVGPITAAAWANAVDAYAGLEDFAVAFLPGGQAPAPGQRFALPAQADTLEAIAATAGEAFYRGPLAEQIATHASTAGAALAAEDLAGHHAEWVTPMAQRFGDVVLHELPPNGQGIAALQALAMLAHTDIAEHAPDSPEALHLQIEAMKLAFADAHRHVADPGFMRVDPSALLDPAYLAGRAALIEAGAAADPGHGTPQAGGTVYLCTADSAGMMVSLIQSNYYGFGSGVVVPGTGISLQNRGAGFSTEPGHANVVTPSKRPFHTIIPGYVTGSGGAPQMAFGVMGGHMQPQGHLQVLLRTALWGQNPQAALDAPRWRVEGGRGLALEDAVPAATRSALGAWGHEISTDTAMGGFGGGQAVVRLGQSWLGASDPRKEGHAAGF